MAVSTRPDGGRGKPSITYFHVFQESDINSIICIIIKRCFDINLRRLQAAKTVNHLLPTLWCVRKHATHSHY